MNNLLKLVQTPYIDAQTLLNLLSDYKRPRECILRMVKNKELIRLKNGFYLIADRIHLDSQTSIPYEQIANMLYGPSYVSLEWALSFYGLIPERVHTVTSMTLGKNKEYNTPIGPFTYSNLPELCYPMGILLKDSSDFPGGFLIASPEKALIDWVYKTCKNLNKQQLIVELVESRRIDPEHLRNLNKQVILEIGEYYKSKSVHHLTEILGLI